MSGLKINMIRFELVRYGRSLRRPSFFYGAQKTIAYVTFERHFGHATIMFFRIAVPFGSFLLYHIGQNKMYGAAERW